MNLRIQQDLPDMDWELVPQILKDVGMDFYSAKIHRKFFENSHETVWVYDNDRLIGFGRADYDGMDQAVIYDVAVLTEYQRRGIGTMIIETLLDRLPHCQFILFAIPGKETFYEKLGFRKTHSGRMRIKNAVRMQKISFAVK